MDPLAPKVARRFLATQEGVIDDDDLKALDPKAAHAWKGYELRLIHHLYTKAEWEESEEPVTRQEHVGGSFVTLESVTSRLEHLKFDKWLNGFLAGKPAKSPRLVTQVDAEVTRKDGLPLSADERDFLSSRLKIRD
jgi:hypothetical protein